jgi:hypothetical protein
MVEVEHQSPDARLLIALTRLEGLAADVAEMRAGIAKLADAYSRLAVIEERQSSSTGALERAFGEIRELRTKVQALEQAQPGHTQTTAWVNRAIGLLIAAAIGATASTVLRPTREAAPVPQIEQPRR